MSFAGDFLALVLCSLSVSAQARRARWGAFAWAVVAWLLRSLLGLPVFRAFMFLVFWALWLVGSSLVDCLCFWGVFFGWQFCCDVGVLLLFGSAVGGFRSAVWLRSELGLFGRCSRLSLLVCASACFLDFWWFLVSCGSVVG